MIAIKNSRKALRLKSDEEDSLLAGVDFQTYYLGRKDTQLNPTDVDTVLEGIYSQYMYSGALNISTQLTITVDPNQLVFRDVMSHNIEFVIPHSSIKSVHCANKKSKFPNAVMIVCCLPTRTVATIHVLHCINQSQAKEFYEAVNGAFDYTQGTETCKVKQQNLGKEKMSKANKGLKENALSSFKVNSSKSTKSRERNTASAATKQRPENENTMLLGAESMADKGAASSDMAKPLTQDETPIKSRTRVKSSLQSKGSEGRNLLDNTDSDDAIDDEFMDFARNRSLSDNIKARFGR